MKTHSVVGLLALLALLPLRGQAQGERKEALEGERDLFFERVARVDRQAADGLARWRVEYLMELTTLQRDLEAAGSTHAAAAVHTEFERFKAAGELADEAPRGPAALVKLRKKHAKLRRALVERRAELMLSVARVYRERLLRLKKQHAAADRKDKVQEVVRELRRLDGSRLLHGARSARAQGARAGEPPDTPLATNAVPAKAARP